MVISLTFGKLTINLDTCPTTKIDFVKKFKGKIPDVDEAWKKISIKLKKNK